MLYLCIYHQQCLCSDKSHDSNADFHSKQAFSTHNIRATLSFYINYNIISTRGEINQILVNEYPLFYIKVMKMFLID